MAGGGIGEAALIGAAVGGGTALVTGNDPLRGALLGGVTGGAGGALMGAGAAAAPTAVTSAGPTIAGSVGNVAGAGAGAGISALPSTGNIMGQIGGANLTGAGMASSLPAAPMANAVSSASMAIPNTTAEGFTRELINAAPSQGISIAANQIPDQIANAGLTPANKGIMGGLGDFYKKLSTMEKIALGIGGGALMSGLGQDNDMPEDRSRSTFRYDPNKFRPSFPFAEGGIIALNTGGMSDMLGLDNPYTSGRGPLDQRIPDPNANNYSQAPAAGYLGNSVKMMASGGLTDLGGYSDGGQLLKGPGDGMSDNIPASIGDTQPARLADGEFVVPADVVSHIGNGSTDAGAKKLYAMMDRVREARTGNKKQGKQIDPAKYMVA